MYANLITAGFLMASPMFATQIIAHRGASHDAPENTLSAVRLGYEQNADVCELDVRLSKDGKIVVIHDPDTKHTGDIAKKVVAQTLDDLHHQNVGNWGKWKGRGLSERIPRLDEVLPLIPDGRRLFIEIKCGPEILPELGHILQRGGKPPGQTVIIGFDYHTMKAAKAKFPDLEVNWLVASPGRINKIARLNQVIEKATSAKLDGLDLNWRFPIDRESVARVHDAGLKLYTWTVDDPKIARREADAGVDGITTNRPGWLREQLAAKS
jgi:glycerophosphoryl diester phosphodiesterase